MEKGHIVVFCLGRSTYTYAQYNKIKSRWESGKSDGIFEVPFGRTPWLAINNIHVLKAVVPHIENRAGLYRYILEANGISTRCSELVNSRGESIKKKGRWRDSYIVYKDITTKQVRALMRSHFHIEYDVSVDVSSMKGL